MSYNKITSFIIISHASKVKEYLGFTETYSSSNKVRSFIPNMYSRRYDVNEANRYKLHYI